MIVLLSVACFLFWSSFQSNANQLYKAGVWLLFIVTAFRHPALGGADNFQYYDVFVNMTSMDTSGSTFEGFKAGYLLMNFLPRLFTDKYIFFQIFYAAVCMFLLNRAIKQLELSGQEKCLFLFGFFTYDFLWYFWGTLRQNVADLIFFNWIIYCYNHFKNYKIAAKLAFSIIGVLIAYQFHSSALITLAAIPFLVRQDEKIDSERRFRIVAISAIIIYLSTATIFRGIAEYMTLLDTRYQHYVESDESSNVINLILKIVMLYLFCKEYNRTDYKYKNFILNMLSLFVLISSVDNSSSGRAAEYFVIGIYVSMAYINRYFRKNPSFKILYFLLFVAIFIRKAIVSDGGLNTHYYLFFQDPVGIPTYFTSFWNNLNFY